MLKLNSSPHSVSEIETYLERVANQCPINKDIYGNILISLTEAVTNAIRHGNENDESKLVEVNLEQKQNQIAFRVSDEGTGFDYQSLPDPTHPENLNKCGGRGVFLMRALCDDLRFFTNGSTVEMRFRI